jgi:MoaA/NifB/PqqE/SkfB family radical SAM enzyme
MSIATTIAPVNERPAVAPEHGEAIQALPALPRVRKGAWRLFREVLEHGGPAYVQFAVTNRCNARCDFCNFAVGRLPARDRRSVTREQACGAIDILARNHVGYLLFVGGEPLLHQDLLAMARHATQSGISPMICTNGSLWTDRNLREFAEAGLSSVIMSIDAHEVEAHERNRGLSGVCRKIKHANETFAKLGVQTTASVTASRLIKDYAQVPEFLRGLGFTSCTFSYPLAALGSSYLSFSDSGLVSYQTEELIEIYERLKRIKDNPHCPVINPAVSLTDMQRHLRGEPERFGCLGGYKYFYLDWHLNLYRCHHWEKPMCRIHDFDAAKLIRDGCTRCMIDCYRDSSVLHHPAVSLQDAWQKAKRGRLLAAANHLLDGRNFTAAKELWRDRHFLSGL